MTIIYHTILYSYYTRYIYTIYVINIITLDLRRHALNNFIFFLSRFKIPGILHLFREFSSNLHTCTSQGKAACNAKILA